MRSATILRASQSRSSSPSLGVYGAQHQQAGADRRDAAAADAHRRFADSLEQHPHQWTTLRSTSATRPSTSVTVVIVLGSPSLGRYDQRWPLPRWLRASTSGLPMRCDDLGGGHADLDVAALARLCRIARRGARSAGRRRALRLRGGARRCGCAGTGVPGITLSVGGSVAKLRNSLPGAHGVILIHHAAGRAGTLVDRTRGGAARGRGDRGRQEQRKATGRP